MVIYTLWSFKPVLCVLTASAFKYELFEGGCDSNAGGLNGISYISGLLGTTFLRKS